MLSLSGRCSGQAGKMDLHLVRDMYTGLLPVNLIYGGMSGFEMLLYMARINTSPFFLIYFIKVQRTKNVSINLVYINEVYNFSVIIFT